MVWNCRGPDSAAPAALNLSTSAGLESIFELGPWFQQGCDLRFKGCDLRFSLAFILGSAVGTTWEADAYTGFFSFLP